MICQFFKFSTIEHFWGFKWIAWVDIRVVLLFYSFQDFRVDLGGELEKLTKYTQIWEHLKFMLLHFDSLYQWKNSSPPLYVIHIQKRLDLLFHFVCLELVLWHENPPKIAIWKSIQISCRIPLFCPNPHCKWSDFNILSLLVNFFVWFYIVGPQFIWIYDGSASSRLEIPLLILASFRTQPGPQSDTSS